MVEPRRSFGDLPRAPRSDHHGRYGGMRERELECGGQQRYVVRTTELAESVDPPEQGGRNPRVPVRRTRRGVGQDATLEHAGREYGDAELLAQREQLVRAGLVEQGEPAGEQDAVGSDLGGLAKEPGGHVRVVDAEGDRADRAATTELVERSASVEAVR